MGAPMTQQDNTDSSSADADPLQKPFAVNSNNDSSLTTYLSLIQQYLAVFMVDNATFLAERCVAQHPSSQEAVYMLALCYYRSNAPKRAQQVITTRQTAAMHLTPSMQYLLSVCAYDLKEYERAEDALLRQCRATFKQNRPTATAQDNQNNNASNGVTVAGTMDDWILTTTPCPIPNGAAGLALLGKICRQAKRTGRAERYFRMSLQLDPFLFTSHAALAEMGVVNLDTASIFGVQPTALQTNPSMAPPSAKTPLQPMMETAKTPLQPMMETPAPQSFHRTAQSQSQSVLRHRSVHFETPGLTPIPVNASLLPAETPPAHHSSTNNNMGPPEHPAVMRRAREVASRQYYPPSPETPSLNSVTRSMRYLRGLGAGGNVGSAMHPGSAMHSSNNNNTSLSSRPTDGMGRSLFAAASSENQSFNSRTTLPPANTANTNTTTMDNDGPEKPEADTPGVHEILEIMCVFGLSYHRLCQYRCRDALQTMQVLPQSQQTTGWVLHQQGKAYLELNDFQSARRCLESMHIHDPGRMQGLELLSTVYWQLKKEVELAHLAQKVVDWDRLSPEAWCVVGNCFSLQKDHETALVFFGRSLQLDPNFTYTHTLSGYEYMANEDFDKAISCFRQAMKTDERHYNAWYGLGAIYHRQEKFDLAEVHFERAAAIHPTSSVLKCNLGIAQYANGKAYQALDTLSEAFRLDPRNPQARFQRATIYSALHRPRDALQELMKVRDAAPREATVHFAMGKVYKRLGQTEQAMKCFLTAMDLDPKENQLIKSAMDKLDEADIEDEVTSF